MFDILEEEIKEFFQERNVELDLINITFDIILDDYGNFKCYQDNISIRIFKKDLMIETIIPYQESYRINDEFF
jgi:hypothetical protein